VFRKECGFDSLHGHHGTGALLKPNARHRAASIDERQLGGLMRSIDEFDGWPTIRAALQLLALTKTRPGDVQGMRRSEVNFEKAAWRIPAERMILRSTSLLKATIPWAK
jgi:integrase